MREQLRQAAIELQVPWLMHFTRASNLASILEQGLLPVSQQTPQMGVTINDVLRLDGHLDGTSLSIAFPNSLMFYKYRMEEPQVKWVVLAVSSSVLWTKDCAFARHNAADGRISTQDVNTLKTELAFRGMFAEIEGHATRVQQRLKIFDPTDVQAEVLVFERIEPELIQGVVFDSTEVRAENQALLGTRVVRLDRPNRGFFASRTYVR